MAIEVHQLPALDARATAAYSHLFQALSEPTRLAVLQHLASGEHRVRDLVEHTGLAQSTVSKHLRFLADCHLVRARPEGQATWYSLTRPHELAALIASAERILHATGNDAVLCTHLRHPLRSPGIDGGEHTLPSGVGASEPGTSVPGAAADCGGAAASSGRGVR